MEALKSINKEVGITVICNLHHLATARSYCERIIGMHAGRIVFDGSPSELTTEKALEVYGTEGDSDELKQALGEGPVQNEDSPISQAAVASG
jgi:phosphonate transport system ATP-binding protein